MGPTFGADVWFFGCLCLELLVLWGPQLFPTHQLNIALLPFVGHQCFLPIGRSGEDVEDEQKGKGRRDERLKGVLKKVNPLSLSEEGRFVIVYRQRETILIGALALLPISLEQGR